MQTDKQTPVTLPSEESNMTYDHIPRLGIYFVDLDVYVMDDYGSLTAIDFSHTVKYAYTDLEAA
jgi:hypothetical protein